MTHSFIQTDFAEPARQAQFEDVRAALMADAGAPPTLLLGNLLVDDSGIPLDAVVLRPHSITVLLFVPQRGLLSIPALHYGAWLLNGQPIQQSDGFDNPFEQFTQQKAALEAWLRNWLSAEQANLRFITGVVVFGGALQFAAEVEEQLNSAAVANGFQLLAEAGQLPRRLRQLATPEIELSETELHQLLAELNDAPSFHSELEEEAEAPATAATFAADPASLPGAAKPVEQPAEQSAPATDADTFLGQKARQLWGWLGAADIPDEDPPYGYDPDAAAARGEEKARLEELRQQMQTELSTQLNAMQAREAEREHSIAQLRTELAQAPAVAPEAATLQARLAAENQEKAALEAAIQASQQEAAARNQALDAKIEQLTHLISQLSARPTEPASVPPPILPAAAPVVTAFSAASAPAPPSPVAAAEVAAPAPSMPVSAPAFVPAPAPVAARSPEAADAQTRAHQSEPPPQSTAVGGFTRWAQEVSQKLAAGWQANVRLKLGQQQGESRRLPKAAVIAGAGLALLLLVGWGVSRFSSNPLVPLQQAGRWGYADTDGKLVIPATYETAGPFQEGRAVVAQAGAYGMVDEKGLSVVAPDYDALNPYAGGYARARVGEAYTFLDEQGQEFGAYYFNALDFAEGYAAVLDHRGWYYITGPEAPATAPLVFREAYSFHDGLARVRLADGYTFISPKFLADSTVSTKPFGRYELAGDFADGQARVRQGGRQFLIDRDGEEVK